MTAALVGIVSAARAQTQVKGGSEDPPLRDRPARIAGRPNFNGIWQAVNTAYWNLESHSAEALNEFPTARRDRRDSGGPERRARRDDSVQARRAREAQREPREVAGGGSRSEVLHARRAARHVPQHAVPDFPGRRRSADGLPVRGGEPRHLHDRSHGAASRFLDGQVDGRVGGRRAGRHHEMAERPVVAGSGRQSCQQPVDGHRALQAAGAEPPLGTRRRWTTRRHTRARGRSRCRCTG